MFSQENVRRVQKEIHDKKRLQYPMFQVQISYIIIIKPLCLRDQHKIKIKSTPLDVLTKKIKMKEEIIFRSKIVLLIKLY